jgi:hypothetical protein
MVRYKGRSSLSRFALCLSLALRFAAFWKFKARNKVGADAALCFANRGAIVCPQDLNIAGLQEEDSAWS